jgi:hypothetical protein
MQSAIWVTWQRLNYTSVLQGVCTYPTAEDAASAVSRMHDSNEDNQFSTQSILSYEHEIADLLTVSCALRGLTTLELTSPWIKAWPEVRVATMIFPQPAFVVQNSCLY